MRYLIFSILIFLTSCNLFSHEEEYSPEIVFSAEDKNGTLQIFTMNDDGTNITKLTSWDEGSVQPSWSPDGKRILFSTFHQSSSLGPGLWLMNADGSNKTPLYFPDEATNAMEGNNARWSPDGTKIVYDLCLNCQVATNYELFIFDTQIKKTTRLTSSQSSETNPTWSPDGSKIAFVSDQDYINADTLRFRKDLYVSNIYKDSIQRITEIGYISHPIWGKSINRIAFVNNNGVFITDFKNDSLKEINTGMKYNGNPLWFKQGKEMVIFGRQENSNPEMRFFEINSNSTELIKIVHLKDNAIGRNYDIKIN